MPQFEKKNKSYRCSSTCGQQGVSKRRRKKRKSRRWYGYCVTTHHIGQAIDREFKHPPPSKAMSHINKTASIQIAVVAIFHLGLPATLKSSFLNRRLQRFVFQRKVPAFRKMFNVFFLSECCMAQRRSLSGRSPFCQRKQSDGRKFTGSLFFFFFLHCRASTRHGRSTTGNSSGIESKLDADVSLEARKQQEKQHWKFVFPRKQQT